VRIAITGGTGFVGRHLARCLAGDGIEVVLVARGADARDPEVRSLPQVRFCAAAIDDARALQGAFAGCDAVAHCAGINRQIGQQTYLRVHVEGTKAVVEAAKRAGVRKIVLLSFLRARPRCGSAYHESKFAAEEIVRQSGLDYTVLKAGMIYGPGDHMLDHLSHSLHTAPIFLKVGLREKPIRPVPIDDLISILRAALVDGRLSRETVAVLGAEELMLSEAVRRVARLIGRRVLVLPAPLFLHHLLARVFERTMKIPLVAIAQVRILSEGVVEALPAANTLPADLAPLLRFTEEQIRAGLPQPGAFGLRDLRCYAVTPT
jgi:nucleoside-diphosphate-sugar epimerase